MGAPVLRLGKYEVFWAASNVFCMCLTVLYVVLLYGSLSTLVGGLYLVLISPLLVTKFLGINSGM